MGSKKKLFIVGSVGLLLSTVFILWMAFGIANEVGWLTSKSSIMLDQEITNSISSQDALPSSCGFYLHQMEDTDFFSGRTELVTFTDIDDKALEKILAYGVFSFVREGNYVVIAGNADTVGITKTLGFSYREPTESDYVIRHLRVRTEDASARSLVSELMLDSTIPPGPCAIDPNYCSGGFFDLAVQCLRDLGYETMPISDDSGAISDIPLIF